MKNELTFKIFEKWMQLFACELNLQRKRDILTLKLINQKARFWKKLDYAFLINNELTFKFISKFVYLDVI